MQVDDLLLPKWGFAKIRGYLFGVPIIRNIVYIGVPLFWETAKSQTPPSLPGIPLSLILNSQPHPTSYSKNVFLFRAGLKAVARKASSFSPACSSQCRRPIRGLWLTSDLRFRSLGVGFRVWALTLNPKP